MAHSGTSTASRDAQKLGNLVFVVFLALKLTDVIDWSWWWVTAPLWACFAVAAVMFAVAIVLSAVASVLETIDSMRAKS